MTEALPDGTREPSGDVRKLTEKVNYFIKPRAVEGQNDKWIPPGVRFLWGTFLFEGVVDSITERLEYFSSDGRPLRANVSLGMSSQDIQFQFGRAQPSRIWPGPDTEPSAWRKRETPCSRWRPQVGGTTGGASRMPTGSKTPADSPPARRSR